ncbi:MAG: hypothetical protein ACE5GQ_05065 [Nitrospinales bacterium]
MKLTPLSRLPVSAKILITAFLITLAFGNVAAGVYTQKYVGISYQSLVETYSEREEGEENHSHPHPHPHEGEDSSHFREGANGAKPGGLEWEKKLMNMEANKFGEIPITLDQIKEMPHKVDLKLLLQDAHVHLFSHGVLSLLMGILFFWSQIPERWKIVLIPLPFLGGVLDFAGMFLVKFLADGFAYLIIFAGSLTGISFAIVFFLSLYELWVVPFKNK